MKTKHKVIFTIIALTFMLVGCRQPEIPAYQSVIETIPSHLYDFIEVMAVENGVFIFDPIIYGTDPDTYILVSHPNKENILVVINSLEYNTNDELVLDLIETSASLSRNYSVIRLVDYTGAVIIKDTETWRTLDTTDLYFSSIGIIHTLSNENLTIGVDNAQITLNLSDEAKELIDSSKVDTNDKILVSYKKIDGQLEALDLKKILRTSSTEGTYTGHADSHTIEIRIDGEYNYFQLSSKAHTQLFISRITDGQSIEFEYIELEHGQKLITNIIN